MDQFTQLGNHIKRVLHLPKHKTWTFT